MSITTAGDDYIETTMDLVFTSGDTSFDISVEILDDGFFENIESFTGNLQIAPGVERVVLEPQVATVNIVDEDGKSGHLYTLNIL